MVKKHAVTHLMDAKVGIGVEVVVLAGQVTLECGRGKRETGLELEQ